LNKTTRSIKELDATRRGSKIGSTLPTERIRENIFCDRDDRQMIPKLVQAGMSKAVYYFCPSCGYTINPLAEKDRKKAVVIRTSDGHSLDQTRQGPRTLTANVNPRIDNARTRKGRDDPTAYDSLLKIMGPGIQITSTKIEKVSKRNSVNRILIIQ
jgi:hypothetical protein